MVAGNYLSGIEFVPTFLKHAPSIGFTIADAVAPAFVFVIALNFRPSFERQLASGRSYAYRYFAVRYLTIFGIGALISAGALLVGKPSDWGVLQALGVAGVICLALIELPTWSRAIIGIVLLIGYEIILEGSALEAVTGAIHGGPLGSLSWAAMLILASVLADLWRRGIRNFIWATGILAAIATLSILLVPVAKTRVSLSFVLLSLALSAIVFLAFELASRRLAQRPGFFCWWGENALTLYLVHLLALAPFATSEIPWWYANAPIWLAALQLALILAVLSLLAWWMHSRRRHRK